MMNRPVIAILALALSSCAAAPISRSTAMTELSGPQLVVLKAALDESRLGAADLAQMVALVEARPDGNYDVSFVVETVSAPGERVVGDPTGRGVSYVISPSGAIVQESRHR